MTTMNLASLTSLGNLITALNTHAQSAMADMSWGNSTEEARAQVSLYIRPLEEAGLPNFVPTPFESLRRFAGGEDVPLAELAAAKTQLEYVSNFFKTLNGGGANGGNGNGVQRLSRMTGTVRPLSVVPPSFRADPVSVGPYGLTARSPELSEVPTKHVRAAILFTDFSQFSKQSKGAQSKYIIDRLNRYFETLIPIAQKTGGIVNKLVGDAIMAFWIDSSNNSLKAVQAALAMQEAVRNLIEDLTREVMKTDAFRVKLAERGKSLTDLTGTDLLEIAREVDPLIPEMKVGINTGWVSYGRLGAKPPYYSEITVIGDAVNTAARMESVCGPGKICLSESTKRELPEGMFDFNDRGLVEAKNIGMVPASEVLRENRIYAVNGSGHKAAKNIHGRATEIKNLTDMFLAAVGESSPSMTMIVGKPGEGKSTIASHFLGRVKDEHFEIDDVDIIYARGEDQPEIEPYQVIADALSIRVGVDLGSNQENGEQRKQRLIENEMKVRAFVESAFTGTDKDRGIAAEILGNFLEIPFEKQSEQMGYLVNNYSDLNTRTIETIIDIFEGLSLRRPVILVVDDMQWTDSGTRNTMHALLTQLSKSPLMILGLRRTETSDPFPVDEPDWESGPFKSQIVDLKPLDSGDLESIVTDALGESIDKAVVTDILSRAEQNPLFAREIAAAVKGGMSLDEMPTTVQDLFQAQLTRLPDDQLEILKRAAIVGRDFKGSDLMALGVADPEQVLPALIDTDFIVKVRDDDYRFRHDLLRETLCGSSNRDKRKDSPGMMEESEQMAYHALFADYLVATGSLHFANIASHYSQAGKNENASNYYVKAAEAAGEFADFKSAADYYEKAFATASGPLQKAKALSGWDESLFLDRRYEYELSLLEDFEALLKMVPATEREVHASVRRHRGQILTYNDRLDEAEHEIKEGLALYGPEESSKNKCDLLSLLGILYCQFRVDYVKTREAYNAQLVAAKKLKDRQLEAMALYNIVRIELYTGNYSEALAAATEVAQAFKKNGDLKMMLSSMNAVASISMMVGLHERPLEILAEAIKLSREKVNGYFLDALLVTNSEVLLALNRYDEAIRNLEEALPTHEGHAPTVFTGLTHSLMAVALAGKGDLDRALHYAEEGLRIMRLLADDSEEARGLVILAQVRLARGEVAEAVTASEEAVQIFERIGTINQFDEKLLNTHIKVLLAAKRTEDAMNWADRAKRLIEGRALKLTQEAHRKTFLYMVPETRGILDQWEKLRVATKALNPALKKFINGISTSIPTHLPGELQFINTLKFREIDEMPGDDEVVGTVVEGNILETIVSIFSKKSRIRQKSGIISRIQAEDIELDPYFNETGVPSADVSFKLAGKGKANHALFKVLTWFGVVADEFKIVLRDKHSSVDGVTTIELEPVDFIGDWDKDHSPLTIAKMLFGKVTLTLCPTQEGNTMIALRVREKILTATPPKEFLMALIEGVR